MSPEVTLRAGVADIIAICKQEARDQNLNSLDRPRQTVEGLCHGSGYGLLRDCRSAEGLNTRPLPSTGIRSEAGALAAGGNGTLDCAREADDAD